MRALPKRIASLLPILIAALLVVAHLARRGEEIELVFVGGVRGVGGSCLLVEGAGVRFLVDCGSTFGGEAPPLPADVSFVIITHAHLDHCGRLPELFAAGFRGPVYCTPPTADLLPVMLRMAGSISRDGIGKDDLGAALFRSGSKRSCGFDSCTGC